MSAAINYATIACHATPTIGVAGNQEHDIPTIKHQIIPVDIHATPINPYGFCGQCGTPLTPGCTYFCCECGASVETWEDYQSGEDFIFVMYP
jgi:hypothetical protein